MIISNGNVKVEYKNGEWLGFYDNKLVANLKTEDWENEFVSFNTVEAGNIFLEGLKDIEQEGFYKTAQDPAPPMGNMNANPGMGAAPPMSMGVGPAPDPGAIPPPPTDMSAPLDLGGPGMSPNPDLPVMTPDQTSPIGNIEDSQNAEQYVPGIIPLEVAIAGMKLRLDGMLMMIGSIKKVGNLSQNNLSEGNDIMQALEEDFITVAESFKEDLSSLYEKIVEKWKQITSNNMVNKFNQEVDKNINTQEMSIQNPGEQLVPASNEQNTTPAKEVPVYQIKPANIIFDKSIRKNASYSLSLNNHTVEYIPSIGVYGYKDNKEISFWNIAKMNDFYRERLDGGDDEILAEFLDEIAGTDVAMYYGTEIGKTANRKTASALDDMALGGPDKMSAFEGDLHQIKNPDAGSSTAVDGDDTVVGRTETYQDFIKRRNRTKERQDREILDQVEEKRQHGGSVEQAQKDMSRLSNKNILLKMAENKIGKIFDSIIDKWTNNVAEGKKGKDKKTELEKANEQLFKDIESGHRGGGVDHSYDCDCCGSKNKHLMQKHASSQKTLMTFSKNELKIEKESHFGKTNNKENDHDLHRILRRKIAEKLIKIGSPDFTITDVKDANNNLLVEVLVFDDKHDIKAKSYRNRMINKDLGMQGIVYCPINGNLPTKLCAVCSLAGNPDSYIKDGRVECYADEIPEYLRNKGY